MVEIVIFTVVGMLNNFESFLQILKAVIATLADWQIIF